jgi:asparagine synthase (glutamine-hydrolysing)
MRTKEAFSDGVSSLQRSWSTIIQEKVESIISSEMMLSSAMKYPYCTPTTKEMYWYRSLFEQYYGSTNASCIPYFWMPRWCPEASDPSARVLDVYTKN